VITSIAATFTTPRACGPTFVALCDGGIVRPERNIQIGMGTGNISIAGGTCGLCYEYPVYAVGPTSQGGKIHEGFVVR
jgi:hypothetical protein